MLIGNAGTKRTGYFEQAAAQIKLPVLFAEWKDFEKWKQRLPKAEWFIKIDPPLWNSCSLEELDTLAEDYKEKLRELDDMSRNHAVEFLNHPRVIAQLLDKRACKKKLVKAGLAVTEMLEEEAVTEMLEEEAVAEMLKKKAVTEKQKMETVTGLLEGEAMAGLTGSAAVSKAENKGTVAGIAGVCQKNSLSERLLQRMKKSGIYQVFLKPVSGSGAAGVSAFRWQPSSGRMVLYTCAFIHPEYGLVNTKCLRRFSKPEEICPLLDEILKLDCVAERWYAKAQHQGMSYDLRAVVLDGRTEFLLGRLSKGPVTNLHLNNHPVKADELGLPVSVREDTEKLCRQAVECFPGLRCAGIDILLERGSLKPRIIEMNAQGDLIYQDIFHENRIYKGQAEIMLKWMCAKR